MENEIYSGFVAMPHEKQKAAVEALIFAASEPMDNEALAKIFGLKVPESNEVEAFEGGIPADIFDNLVAEINSELLAGGRPYSINRTAGGYMFATRPEYGELLQFVSKYRVKKRLSPASLETLAIIAYKQPITKPEVEQIRGVNSNEIVNSLIEKEFVKIVGRREVLGKPLTYGTTQQFLRAFGLMTLAELPKLREIDEILADDARAENVVTIDASEIEQKPAEFAADEVEVIPEESQNI